MELLEQLKESVVRGHMNADSKYPPDMKGRPGVAELTQKGLDEGLSVEQLLQQALIPGMDVVGDRFSKGEYFVPEMLMSAKAMKAGTEILRPLMTGDESMSLGKVIMGSVQGDMHEIGKNLVGMMLEGAGFEVEDLGMNIPPDKFVSAAKESPDAIVGLSALLTITMEKMRSTIDALREAGLENKVMIGGAPVTQQFADEIGADGYSPDASQAVVLAKSLLS